MYSEVLFNHDLRFVIIVSVITYIFQVLDVFEVWGILKKKLSLSICKMNPTKSLAIQPFLSAKLVPKLLEENTRKTEEMTVFPIRPQIQDSLHNTSFSF